MAAYRVFISYSHDETDKFQLVHDALEQLGLKPWFDARSAGKRFTEQIQDSISHSHLFVPILTPASHQAGWVHQEIGFALAMHVPFIPICQGSLPDGMIQMAHAIVVNDLGSELTRALARQDFNDLVSSAGKQWLPAGECAYEPGERAEMIERFADAARRNLGPQCVRHAGGLSSFRIPDAPPNNKLWECHYGSHSRGDEMFKKLRRERKALATHADAAGCKLIINNGVDLDKAYGEEGVWNARLHTFVEYLESLPDELVEIAIVTEAPPHALLMVGDWFLAESAAVRPVRGIQHTLFVSHAPSIDRRIEEFDFDLQGLLKKQGSPPGRSRTWAIDVLKRQMRELPRHAKLS